LTLANCRIRYSSTREATKAAVSPRQSPRRDRSVLKCPKPAKLLVATDTLALPFRQAMPLRLGATYEAKTLHRVPLPSELRPGSR
jgi:hypothetical protein